MNALSLDTIAVALSLGACAKPAPPASQATVDALVARATANAGDDLKYLLGLCQPQTGQRVGQGALDQALERAIALPPPEHGQVFDNLYFVGSSFVSAWVLKTSDGLILIDALNNALEAQSLIEGGMRKLGLDPAQIKYVIITHGHGDHYGGAPMLVQKYGARAVASESDWMMMETGLEFDSPLWGRPPKRDITILDGDWLTLGDTTVTLYVTPGHTLGTISPVFDVKAGGRSFKALLWGGTAFNFGRGMDRLDHYVAQTQRMERLATRYPIDVMLSNHPLWDDLVVKMAKLRTASIGSHPFVSGREVVGRSLRVMEECAQAQLHRFRIF